MVGRCLYPSKMKLDMYIHHLLILQFLLISSHITKLHTSVQINTATQSFIPHSHTLRIQVTLSVLSLSFSRIIPPFILLLFLSHSVDLSDGAAPPYMLVAYIYSAMSVCVFKVCCSSLLMIFGSPLSPPGLWILQHEGHNIRF